MQSGMITTDFGWGTPNFHKMGRKKIELIYLFTQMGFDILVSDVDTAWLRNPMPYMARSPQADVLTSSDHLSSTAVGDGLEDPSRAHSAANIGIMLLRHSAKELAKEWVEKLEKDDKVWDQNAFNDLFRLGAGFNQKDEDNVFAGYRGKLKIGILPVSTFASGHTYFVTRMYEKVKQEPYVIHATFQFSGTDGKRHRLRRFWWCRILRAHDPPGGLLSYVADIPEDLLRHSGSVEGHFALVNHQLLQVRAALAFAQKLKRTLVMPKLYCGFDRWWAPHSGKIPGSRTPSSGILSHRDPVFEIESWSVKNPMWNSDPALTFGSTASSTIRPCLRQSIVRGWTWNSWRVVNMGSARKTSARRLEGHKNYRRGTQSSRTSMSRSCSALIKTSR